MSRSNPVQRSFSAGEVSPLLYGRPDYQRTQTGLRQCRGFLPLRQGAVTRAPGTIYRGATRGNGEARLIGFQFAADDAVVLEFSALRMRVWRYGALVMSGGVPYELVTPYDMAAVRRLSWMQEADVIDFVDGAINPRRLSRLALDNWTITTPGITGGPFRVENADTGVRIKASAATGTITLDGTGGPFVAAHVGSLFQLRATEDSSVPLWVGNRTTAVGDLWRYDGRIYEVTAGNNTGPNPPTHHEGTVKLGDGTFATMAFVSDLIGIVRVTAVTSANLASATVVKRVPSSIVAASTFRWSEGAFSTKNGFPSAIGGEDQRRVYADTAAEPRTMWFSTAGTDRDFEPGTDADSSFAYGLAGSRTQNRIHWLQSGARGLYAGTLGEVYAARPTATQEAIGPQNASFGSVSAIGSSTAQPIAPNGTPIYISSDRQRLFELRYSLADEAYAPVELSLPSEHLGNAGFEELAWQSSPLRLVWVRRSDGTAAIMVNDPAEDVLGWAPYSVAGGAIESIVVSPDATGSTDIVTMVVRRTVDGATKRYVEEVAFAYGLLTGAQPVAEAVHLFAAVVLTGAAAAERVIDGLDHLEGATVSVWSDRGDLGTFVVEGGEIAFEEGLTWFPDLPAGRLTIGLFDASHILETLDVQLQLPEGASLGRQKRVKALGLRWHRTAAAEVSHVERQFGKPDIVSPWREAMALPVPVDLVEGWSGVANLVEPTGWAPEITFRLRPKGGAPMTLAALMAVGEVSGG